MRWVYESTRKKNAQRTAMAATGRGGTRTILYCNVPCPATCFACYTDDETCAVADIPMFRNVCLCVGKHACERCIRRMVAHAHVLRGKGTRCGVCGASWSLPRRAKASLMMMRYCGATAKDGMDTALMSRLMVRTMMAVLWVMWATDSTDTVLLGGLRPWPVLWLAVLVMYAVQQSTNVETI